MGEILPVSWQGNSIQIVIAAMAGVIPFFFGSLFADLSLISYTSIAFDKMNELKYLDMKMQTLIIPLRRNEAISDAYDFLDV